MRPTDRDQLRNNVSRPIRFRCASVTVVYTAFCRNALYICRGGCLYTRSAGMHCGCCLNSEVSLDVQRDRGGCLNTFAAPHRGQLPKSAQNGPFSIRFRSGFGRVSICRYCWRSGSLSTRPKMHRGGAKTRVLPKYTVGIV